jgi:hypothetical protein
MNLDSIKNEFPIRKRMVYLNNASIGPLSKPVIAAEELASKGYEVLSPMRENERSGILSFRNPRVPLHEIAGRLEAANVHSAVRGSGIRISPSIYNDADDIGAMLEALP